MIVQIGEKMWVEASSVKSIRDGGSCPSVIHLHDGELLNSFWEPSRVADSILGRGEFALAVDRFQGLVTEDR